MTQQQKELRSEVRRFISSSVKMLCIITPDLRIIKHRNFLWILIELVDKGIDVKLYIKKLTSIEKVLVNQLSFQIHRSKSINKTIMINDLEAFVCTDINNKSTDYYNFKAESEEYGELCKEVYQKVICKTYWSAFTRGK